MIKTYVVDTNVLIQAPYAVQCFEDNHVVLPVVVLEELDNLKKAEGEKGRSPPKDVGRRGVEGPADNRAGHGGQCIEIIKGAGLHDESRQKLTAVGERTEQCRHTDRREHEAVEAVPNERHVHSSPAM